MHDETNSKTNSLAKLLTDLKQHSWSENWRTADLLAEFKEAAVPSLIAALEDVDGFVRNGAAIALGKIGRRESVPALFRALRWSGNRDYEYDEDQEARASAATALGLIGGHDVCVGLTEALQEALQTGSTSAEFIIDALGTIGDPHAVPALSTIAQNGEVAACFALARIGNDGTRAVFNLISDRTRQGRQYAVRALGASSEPECIPVLIWVAGNEDEDSRIRGEALRVLGRVGRQSSEVLPVLSRMLDHPDAIVRWGALFGLGTLGDSRAYELITKQLELPEARCWAVVALGNLGDRRACELLIPMLGDGDYSLRTCAAEALGKLGCTEAVPDLVHLRDTLGEDAVQLAQKATVENALRQIQQKSAEPSGGVNCSA
jgi:HEAT repeat protein